MPAQLEWYKVGVGQARAAAADARTAGEGIARSEATVRKSDNHHKRQVCPEHFELGNIGHGAVVRQDNDCALDRYGLALRARQAVGRVVPELVGVREPGIGESPCSR